MRAKDNVTQADAGTSIAGCALDNSGRPGWPGGVKACLFLDSETLRHMGRFMGI